ncbi:MAG: co-chaperone DjlA [Deltaproteobacteria bacterium]|nr:co-chaperone DjlA [Deltaproteobacteria bacterium]
MSWWGKLIGGTFGFMIGGPLGALLGAAVGHSFDKSSVQQVGWGGPFRSEDFEEVQTAFFTAVFSIMGHLAKADGQVSSEEINIAERIMDRMELQPAQRRAAVNLFNRGKSDDFPLEDVLDQFRRICQRRFSLIQMFLEIMILTVVADGAIHDEERRILVFISDRLSYPRAEFERLLTMIMAQERYSRLRSGAVEESPSARIKNAYSVLGIPESASDEDIKKAFRRLMNQHHPDKLVSKGLPEEMIRLASEKTRKIKEAYDFIREVRKAA